MVVKFQDIKDIHHFAELFFKAHDIGENLILLLNSSSLISGADLVNPDRHDIRGGSVRYYELADIVEYQRDDGTVFTMKTDAGWRNNYQPI